MTQGKVAGPKMNLAAAYDKLQAENYPPMFHEIMAAGADEETARFVARMLRKHGYYLVNPDEIGWPEIDAFRGELGRGQDHREDAGGFFVRAIKALLGIGSPIDEVITHRKAALEMLKGLDS